MTNGTSPDTTLTAALLAAATLTADETELTAITSGQRLQRSAVDALYAVPEARYADPALRFRAQARIEDWSHTV